MNNNSLEAFEKVLPKINDRQNLILQHLSWVGPQTDAMISASVKLPINCITNRRGELRKKGLITKAYNGKCMQTGGTASYWIITEKGKEVAEWKRN